MTRQRKKALAQIRRERKHKRKNATRKPAGAQKVAAYRATRGARGYTSPGAHGKANVQRNAKQKRAWKDRQQGRKGVAAQKVISRSKSRASVKPPTVTAKAPKRVRRSPRASKNA